MNNNRADLEKGDNEKKRQTYPWTDFLLGFESSEQIDPSTLMSDRGIESEKWVYNHINGKFDL